jgi:hypothetical protein
MANRNLSNLSLAFKDRQEKMARRDDTESCAEEEDLTRVFTLAEYDNGKAGWVHTDTGLIRLREIDTREVRRGVFLFSGPCLE